MIFQKMRTAARLLKNLDRLPSIEAKLDALAGTAKAISEEPTTTPQPIATDLSTHSATTGRLDVAAIQDPLARHLAAWANGVAHEIDWWGEWFATKGSQWPDKFLERQSTDVNNPEDLLDIMGILDHPEQAEILDVGAGPLTVLMSRHNGARLKLIATDPLAPFYAEMARKNDVHPPVPTTQAYAEDLTAVFDEERFDVVHCRNALDHSFDPVRGIEEMLAVTKVGGRVVLRHSRNEAVAANYEGLHQWNFDERSGAFVIWSPTEEVDASAAFSYTAETVVWLEGDWITVIYKKHTHRPMDLAERYRQRTQSVLSNFLTVSAAGFVTA